MKIVNADRNVLPRYRTATILCLVLLIALLLHPSYTSADDKHLTAIESTLALMRVEIAAIHADIRADHLLIIKKTAVLDERQNALSDRVDTLDAAHEYATLIGQNVRITAIETKLDLARADREAQKAEAKAEHDSLMAWLRPGISGMFLALFGAVVGLTVQWWRDKRRLVHEKHLSAVADKAEVIALRVEKKTEEAIEAANHYKAKVVKTDARQDRQEARMDEQAERLENIADCD